MTVSQVRRQWSLFPAIGPWWVDEALKQHPAATEPRPALPPLLLRLRPRRRSHQWLPGVRPAIRMRVPRVVVLQESQQPLLEFRCAGEIAALQETAGQHAEPQFHLIEPR